MAPTEAPRSAKTFNVLTMSEEFFRLTELMPEMSEAPYVVNGSTRTEGATSIMKATSIAEIDAALPEIAKKVPTGHRLVVIEYSHSPVGKLQCGIGRRYVLDLSKMPATA